MTRDALPHINDCDFTNDQLSETYGWFDTARDCFDAMRNATTNTPGESYQYALEQSHEDEIREVMAKA